MEAPAEADLKAILLRYLLAGRDALRWKLEDLSPYDARRPLTPTATNLLGLNRHVALCAADYFGSVFDRPFPEPSPDMEADPLVDMWVPADLSTRQVLDFVDRAWTHAEDTIAALSLGAEGRVPWWQPPRDAVTLQQIMTHMIAETHRHAGHADIVRETIDGAAGLRAEVDNMPDGTDWPDHRQRVEDAARAAT